MTKISHQVHEALQKLGPSLSTKVASHLMNKYALTSVTARQRISRSGPDVLKLKGIRFPHRSEFIYLRSQYGSQLFFNRLISALEETNNAYYYGLSALKSRGGILPINHFKIACSAPKMQSKQITADLMIENLLTTNLIKCITIPGIGECLALNNFSEQDMYENHLDLKARIISERIALQAIKEWVRRLGLGSYDMVLIRDESEEIPSAGPNYWDLSAPSYLYPLLGNANSKGAKKPGSIVCDIYLGHMTIDGINGFIKKCHNVRGFSNVSPMLQMFVADTYPSEVISKIKKIGAIAATMDTIFGKDVAQAIRELSEILKTTAKKIDDFEKLNYIFSSLTKIEGAASTLRGCLFEYISAAIARHYYSTDNIQISKIVKDSNGNEAEIDVFVISRGGVLTIVECKGHKPMGYVDEKEVEKWIQKRIPTIRGYIKNHPDYYRCEQHYEIWTNGRLTVNSKSYIAAEQQKTDKYNISFREGDDMEKIAKDSRDAGLYKSYIQHFTKNPLAIINQQME